MDHNSSISHIAHLLLKGLSIGTVSALTHPITYPISASALLCQANIIRTSGGQATIIKTFMSLASVAVEDVSHFLYALMISKYAGLLFNIHLSLVNGPLDVIRTRLVLEEFGIRPTQTPRTLASQYRKIVREEGWTTLYSGWEVVILQFALDYWLQLWDRHASFQKQKGSILQLLPMLAKFVADYALTVVKIRARTINILKSVVTQKGLRGFMAGWKIHLLLFPVVMVNMVLANLVFLQLKKIFFPHHAHHGGASRGPIGPNGTQPTGTPPENVPTVTANNLVLPNDNINNNNANNNNQEVIPEPKSNGTGGS